MPGRARGRCTVSDRATPLVGAALLALLATSGPAAAASKPISGKLSKSSYTVIAIGLTGQKAVRASRGRFS